jgi:exosortase/archaeosortase family protein
VPTDTASPPLHAPFRFAAGVAAWSLGLFGLFRVGWIEAHVVLPLTRGQADLAVTLLGAPAQPVAVTLACSGTDALALALGTVLAYPVAWRSRLLGAAGAAALILALNTLRIGTLGRAAASPAWFEALHVYIWPVVLTLAIAGYAFAWMTVADRRRSRDQPVAALRAPTQGLPLTRRFIILTLAFLAVFAAASPLYLDSAAVLSLATFVAHAAAALLAGVGVAAHATDNVLWTPRGGFLVTQECVSTPLIPVYLAAVCTWLPGWRRLIPLLLATLPLFVGLGILRLLVVALPDVAGSSLFLVHAFYQLLIGLVLVCGVALWRHGGRAALGPALAAVAAGLLIVVVAGPVYTRAITAAAGAPLHDPQGAVTFLPAFQVGLFVALWVAAFVALSWTRLAAGLALLGLTQTAGLVGLHALASHTGLTPHVRDIRGWAVAGPMLILAAVVHGARARR